MKVILYMAMTANGFVATDDDQTDWVSPEGWERFRKMAQRTGNVVMGRITYEFMVKDRTFPLKGSLNVVMTRNAPDAEPLKNVLFSDKSPEEIVEELAAQGFTEVLLAGGGELNGSFMTDGLVDEIYLTVEPTIFGSGVHLFGPGDFRRDLDLLDIERISENEVQLHYRVRRPTLENYLGE